MKLLVDLGNSVVKWVFNDQGRVSGFTRVEHRNNLQAYLFKSLPANTAILKSIHISSVASVKVESFFTEYLMQHYGLKAIFVKSDAEFHGVINAYSHPEQLGVDRWLAIIAAYQQVEGAVLVVDCGTAVTIDAVNGNGQHLGGLILPGLYTMWQGLNANAGITTKIERGEFEKLNLFATDTAAAVTLGPLIAIAATIEKMIDKLRKQEQLVTCMLTGGDASKLQALISEKTILSPHLVLEGLSLRIKDHGMDKRQ